MSAGSGVQLRGTDGNLIHRAHKFVIRLNLGDHHRQPRLIDANGEPIKLFIRPGETVIRPNVYYLGKVKVNLIGYWRKSLSKPLWVMTTLEPKRGLEIYQKRVKIDDLVMSVAVLLDRRLSLDRENGCSGLQQICPQNITT